MDLNFVLRMKPKPQRIQRRNTTPEDWLRICEERKREMMDKINTRIETTNEGEFNNDLAQNLEYAVDKNDWEDIEKWEIENTEKSPKKKIKNINIYKNIDISAIPESRNTVSPLENISERPGDEQMEEMTDQMENLNIN